MSKEKAINTVKSSWITNEILQRNLAYFLVAVALAAGIITVVILTGDSKETYDAQTILNLIYLDGIILLLMGLVVAWRLAKIWQDRRSGQAGSGLHVRLVVLFGLVAVTPAILVAVFSLVFINYGLEKWFNQVVFNTITQSRIVAEAYLTEHRKNIDADTFAIASDLKSNAPFVSIDPHRLNQILSKHAALRSLSEALIINKNGEILARSEFSLSINSYIIPTNILEQTTPGRITIFSSPSDDRMRAFVKLDNYTNSFLLIERFVDPKIISHVKRINDLVARYQAFKKERGGIQISFVMIFVVVAVLLLMTAIWIGLTVATQLAKPISSLISAAKKISDGDLNVKVEASSRNDEVSTLGRTFNAMTSQLKNTQQVLMNANRQIDERRRFTETVLAGVSAGVIGLDANGRIHLPNRSASEFLKINLEKSIGKIIDTVIPEMKPLIEKARQDPNQVHREEIQIGQNGQFRMLMVSVAAEQVNGEVDGYVITFDDVTELLSAQRMAAWSDVARRIAHEIKNPLTPIQLSAERLKRKYLSEISSDKKTFINCTETIIRQVEDLHRMVDEFSSFARMPELSLKEENLSEICRQAISLELNRNPEINYFSELPNNDLALYCDHRQISRALTNLLKNASESVNSLAEELNDSTFKGYIKLNIETNQLDGNKNANEKENVVSIVVLDNGRGLPKKNRETLTEPYITTRTKGTGLGLSIVKKIMDDHNGKLVLTDGEDGGAKVSLIFPPLKKITVDKKLKKNKGKDPLKVATSLVGKI
ncbi:MAG: PAS domain-containing sensor histidine kinase [Pseudomonadota bacterium]|nr:PAS domain-containing sensor histidine kinase [Pseudomonadota bacterium]